MLHSLLDSTGCVPSALIVLGLLPLRALQWRRSQRVTCVQLGSTPLQLPSHCANCGDPAGQLLRERGGGRELLVPYCARCFGCATRAGTRALALSLSSVLIGVTLLFTVPRLAANLGLPGFIALLACGACLPLGVGFLLERRGDVAQSSVGRAVWLRGDRLFGTNGAWMAELAQVNGLNPVTQTAREPIAGPGAWSGAALCVALAPLAHSYLFPTLLVLNLAAPQFDFVVDGSVRGRVEPSSLESPEAGLRLRVAAGRHRFEARAVADGSSIAAEDVAVDAGGNYLFAPASDEFCFWLESSGYGRSAGEPSYQPLPPGRRFWRLPDRIDSWFASNPKVGSDQSSTGGTMVALRQARCAQMLDLFTSSAP